MHIPASLRFVYDTTQPSEFLVHTNAPLMAPDRGPVAPLTNMLLMVHEVRTAGASITVSTVICAVRGVLCLASAMHAGFFEFRAGFSRSVSV
jgi:hypothetical protein